MCIRDSRNTTHLGVSWNRNWASGSDPGLPVLLCELQISQGRAAPWRAAYGGSGDGALLHGLRPGQRMRLRLRCANLLGPSDWSEERTLSTEAARPQPPSRPLVLRQEDGGRVSLGWRAPEDTGGEPLLEYVLEVQGLSSEGAAPCSNTTAGWNASASAGAAGNRTAAWEACLLYTSPSPRDGLLSRMPSSA